MPFIYKCSRCQEVLATFTSSQFHHHIAGGRHAPLDPTQKIIDEYDGKCPNCGKKLEVNPNHRKITVQPW